MCKDFDETIHAVCPMCGFELLYNDYEEQETTYLYKHGICDEDTIQGDTIGEHMHQTVECNSRYCNYSETWEDWKNKYC